ncbi:hypothetical protein BX070DRAFT_233796 [Coemansia spiralis]|nr:hypothetical protein BX070DRAFT_233796 [Coemansia spiralis]
MADTDKKSTDINSTESSAQTTAVLMSKDPNSSNSSGAVPPSTQGEYKDCLPCKVVGAGAMTGLAGYVLYERARMDPIRFASRRRGLLGISMVLAGTAIYRLCQ